MPKHAAIRAPKPLTAHDRNLVINRAPSPRNLENIRNLIKTRALVLRLQNFATDDPDNPTGPRLTRTQAMVGLSLLRKVLPDMQALEISGNSEKPLVVQVLRFSDGLVIDADHNPVGAADNIGAVASDIADTSSAIDVAESGTNPSLSAAGNDADPYSVPSSDALPDALEHNARLIEDEKPRRKTSPQRTPKRKRVQ